MKRMKHPLHGLTWANTPIEEAAAREHGWVDDVEPVAEPAKVAQEPAAAPVPVKKPPKREHGRKVN